MNAELIISKADFSNCSILESKLPTLEKNQVILQIYKFGFTANNITYAAIGEAFLYFKFFPVSDPNFVKIPVWGLAKVVESLNDDIKVGEIIYGYFPMSKYIVFNPSNITSDQFVVDRPGLPLTYNQYNRMNKDPLYSKESEDLTLIFRPLWFTSFYLDDFLKYHNFYDADSVIVSSASSKTGYCLAMCLQGSRKPIVGLTSRSNVEFVKSLGLYNSVYSYDELDNLEKQSFVYVDFAGNTSLSNRIHSTLEIKKQVGVGLSHFDPKSEKEQPTFAKESSVFFFVPEWIPKRIKEDRSILAKSAQAWSSFTKNVGRLVHFKHFYGPDAVKEIYLDMLAGNVDPQNGNILSLFDMQNKL